MSHNKEKDLQLNLYFEFRAIYLEINNFSIKVPFKLHGQLAQLVNSQTWRMYASGKQKLPIWSGLYAMACCRELQVLYKINLPPANFNSLFEQGLA